MYRSERKQRWLAGKHFASLLIASVLGVGTPYHLAAVSSCCLLLVCGK